MTIKTKNFWLYSVATLVVLGLSLLVNSLYALQSHVEKELINRAQESRWLVLIHGDVLETDEVGRSLLQLPDVEDVKLLTAADLLATVSDNNLFVENLTDAEKEKLSPAWQIQWKPTARALSFPSDSLAEIRTYKNVLDVAYDQASIKKVLLLQRLQHALNVTQSLLALIGFLLTLLLGWYFVSTKAWKGHPLKKNLPAFAGFLFVWFLGLLLIRRFVGETPWGFMALGLIPALAPWLIPAFKKK